MSRHHYPRRDRAGELDALYATLPALECRGRCQDSCGPIDMSATERRRITGRGVDIPPLRDAALVKSCPALTVLGTCRVYEVRPLLCRLWGLVEKMACPYGCLPEGGWLDDATAGELLRRSLDIGGRAGTMNAATAAQARRLVAGVVGAVMREGPP